MVAHKLTPLQQELICDVLEALELTSKWWPLYRAVLKRTGDRQQAIRAVTWCVRMEEELEPQ